MHLNKAHDVSQRERLHPLGNINVVSCISGERMMIVLAKKDHGGQQTHRANFIETQLLVY